MIKRIKKIWKKKDKKTGKNRKKDFETNCPNFNLILPGVYDPSSTRCT